MAFETVTDIATLVSRQQAIDKKCVDKRESCQVSHAALTFDDLIPSVIDRFAHGEKCATCGCATVGVESHTEGDIIRVCRDVVDAIKEASLVHDNPSTICYRCKIKRNPNGIIAGHVCFSLNIEDDMTNGILRTGFRTRVAAGLIEMDADTDPPDVIIHDLAHTAEQHCRGCRRVRHPECTGASLCENFVAL